MRLKCFIILFTIIFPLLSQNNPSTEVDSLLNESQQKFIELKFIESSEIADQALHLSILNNYSKGIVMSKLYIAKVLLEIGLNMEALEYLEEINEEPFFRKEVIPQVESHRLKGRVYGNQQLYSLAKVEFENQLLLSENIQDLKKKELSILWAYQNLEHLYSLQGLNDSVEVYQDLQEEQLQHFEEQEAFYNISTLCSSKARLYFNRGEFDNAKVEIQKSIDILEKYNIPYRYANLQMLGDLEASKGNIDKAISYYDEALENSLFLNATYTSRDLHKKLSNYMLNNDTLIDKARQHRREYGILNDSLESHNRMVVNSVLENIIKDKDKASGQKTKSFRYIVIGIIFFSLLIAFFLFLRIMVNNKKLSIKNKQLATRSEEIVLLEEELENNIFQDIIELAKSNSPEFLPLFEKGYPEFLEAMRNLNPSVRSSELYFCALAYLNFSTKDISEFTFVTIRAVQVRKNRLRKKYDIPSEVDFNEWFRNLENENILRS